MCMMRIGVWVKISANREFIAKSVCLSAALYPTKMSEYPGVGGAWWLLYARNERKATVLSVSAQIRGVKCMYEYYGGGFPAVIGGGGWALTF